jgi:hypothetical protein
VILHFQISEGDSILVAAAQVVAIRETNSDLVIYLVGGREFRVPNNDYNRSAEALWQEYIEGGGK